MPNTNYPKQEPEVANKGSQQPIRDNEKRMNQGRPQGGRNEEREEEAFETPSSPNSKSRAQH